MNIINVSSAKSVDPTIIHAREVYMKAIKVPETQRILNAPPGQEDEIYGLPIHQTTMSGFPVIVSVWMLSEEDLMKIRAGANIRLAVISNTTQPPVMLWVE